ncbi:MULTISPECIES: hypothetical protein [Caballeronia]|uniref:hypothetical protein n=1 Tax=Caballeronia TaxID=1827195 RepID=UPI001FD07868|nr:MULTISPECIES: hypothetical protein [Caballeronia]MDR5799107.1 hypothetical protein [Caballeronia sp. LZ001]
MREAVAVGNIRLIFKTFAVAPPRCGGKNGYLTRVPREGESVNKPDYAVINAELERLFALDGATKFDAAVRSSAAGEIFGQAMFRGLYTFAKNREERRLWDALAKIETVTLEQVSAYMKKYGVPPPDREIFAREGYRVAALFEGTSVDTYFEWLEPEVKKAVKGFASMLDMSSNPNDRALAGLLVKHEDVIAKCCESIRRNGSINDACIALEVDFTTIEH